MEAGKETMKDVKELNSSCILEGSQYLNFLLRLQQIYHKRSSLKQHTFVILQFWGQKSSRGLTEIKHSY